MAFTIVLNLIAVITLAIAAAPIPSTDIKVVEFTTEGISGKLIDISAKGSELYGMDDTNTIYRFDSYSKKWTPKPKAPQPIQKIAASPEGGAWATSFSNGDNSITYIL